MNTYEREVALNKIGRIDTGFATADAGLLGSIFGLFTKESSKEFLEHTGHLFLFPFAALASVVRAGLAWREASLDKKRGTIVRASVETVAAVAITTAVVGSLVATSVFALAAPIIFTAVLGAKALFHAGSAFYNLGKASLTQGEEKIKYVGRAKSHAIGAVTTGLFAAAVGLVMIAAKPIFAVLAIIGSAIGVVMGIFKGFKQHKEAKKLKAKAVAEKQDVYADNEVGNTKTLTKFLGNGKNLESEVTQPMEYKDKNSSGLRFFDNRLVLTEDNLENESSHSNLLSRSL